MSRVRYGMDPGMDGRNVAQDDMSFSVATYGFFFFPLMYVPRQCLGSRAPMHTHDSR